MTIFEMLEKLETQILSLQARYLDVASCREHLEVNGAGRGVAQRKRTGAPSKTKAVRRPAKKAKKKLSVPSKPGDFEQLEFPVQEPPMSTEQQQTRVLGKRQALGKSLVQLRKMSAWRKAQPEEE